MSVFQCHADIIRTNDRFCCDDLGCTRSYKRFPELKRHKAKHSGIRDHACTIIGCNRSGMKGLTRKDDLRQHLKQVHGFISRGRGSGARVSRKTRWNVWREGVAGTMDFHWDHKSGTRALGFYWSRRKRGIFLETLKWLARLHTFISFLTHEYGQRRIGVLWGRITRCQKGVILTVYPRALSVFKILFVLGFNLSVIHFVLGDPLDDLLALKRGWK